jgi:hypothetical protein
MGFILGLLIMSVAVRVFTVNSFDFEAYQHGTRLILQGINPWSEETRIPVNPPFSVLFYGQCCSPTSQFYHVIGGALLFAFVFYHKAWVGLAWFATIPCCGCTGAGG